jgi:hypothetical protein
MENIKITTKYLKAIKIVLLAVVFSVSLPFIALAEYNDIGTDVTYGYDNDNYYDTGSDYGSGYENDYPSYNDVGSDYGSGYYYYNDIGSDVYSGGYNDIGSDVYSYGYNDVGSDVYAGYYNDIGSDVASGDVTSGSYSGGNYYYPYSYSGSRWVTSGGYSVGGSSYVTPPIYNYSQSGTVTSGDYSGGNSTYVEPTTYNYYQSNTVTSGGYSGLNPVYYTQTTTYPNQVLAYTDTNPSLDSVYLSDVPYTGFEDYFGILAFISTLVSFSAILAYVFLKRKIESETIFAKAYENKTEIKNESSDSVTSSLMNQIVFDNSDISKVNDYARMNKVLLSSDAAAKIVKLKRLGQMNASEYIKSIATGEWIAIGENQII